jgi:hypothetical protein
MIPAVGGTANHLGARADAAARCRFSRIVRMKQQCSRVSAARDQTGAGWIERNDRHLERRSKCRPPASSKPEETDASLVQALRRNAANELV